LRKRRGQFIAIVFFYDSVATKKVMTPSYRHLFLWWCRREEEEEDNNFHHLL
jgi:hypothetical protein